jgi:hypothetical protein
MKKEVGLELKTLQLFLNWYTTLESLSKY